MSKRQLQTMAQAHKINNDLKYLRDCDSQLLNPGIRKYFQRRSNKATRRFNRAICKDFQPSWLTLQNSSRILRR